MNENCESTFEFCYGVLWRNLAQTVQHELRTDAYGHVQKLEMAYFENRSSGSLVTVRYLQNCQAS